MTSLTSLKICVLCGGIFSIYAMAKQKQPCPKCHPWTIFGDEKRLQIESTGIHLPNWEWNEMQYGLFYQLVPSYDTLYSLNLKTANVSQPFEW